MNIKEYLAEKKQVVEEALAAYMLVEKEPLIQHIKAMRYSLFAGGKRVRPILAIAAAEALQVSHPSLLPIACALECIHTYSLIHDDLPAMDNDDLRRGKPTSHMVFGEAEAILAGDGLLSLAFDLMAHPEVAVHLSPAENLRIIGLVARAIGPLGMVGGQSLDLAAEGRQISLDQLQFIHRCKTGALITASVQAGAIFAGADAPRFEALTTYGEKIGLAFQIVDDLLDVVGSTEELGKTAGADLNRQKATYPSFLGVEKTRELARDAVAAAVEALNDFDHRADPLRELAHYIYSRNR
jgi:geranylgeranyl diphosphate synthase type II